MKAVDKELLITEKIRVADQRFRNYRNLLRRIPGIIHPLQSKHLPNDFSTLKSATDPVQDQD
jgi:hypothetical protein